MARRKTFRRYLFLSHRYIGLGCALFVLLLSVTGIMLNHTEQLQLDQQHLQSPALLNWYGIDTPEVVASYAVGQQWLTEFGRKLYLDGVVVSEIEEPLLGAITVGEWLVAALPSQLMLISHQGELIERLDSSLGLPGQLQKIGRLSSTSTVVIQTQQGSYISDQEMFDWQATRSSNVQWSVNATPSNDLLLQLRDNHSGNGLTLERFLLDLHSGRIVGPFGVLIMDVAAILLIAITLLGVWMWARR